MPAASQSSAAHGALQSQRSSSVMAVRTTVDPSAATGDLRVLLSWYPRGPSRGEKTLASVQIADRQARLDVMLRPMFAEPESDTFLTAFFQGGATLVAIVAGIIGARFVARSVFGAIFCALLAWVAVYATVRRSNAKDL